MKKIAEKEPFQMNGKVFAYEVLPDGNIKLARLNEVVKVKKQPFIPPTLEEVKAFFTENGYSHEGAEKAFNHYTKDGANWTDSRGNKVNNWRQKMRTNWFRDEHKKAEAEPQATEPKVVF